MRGQRLGAEAPARIDSSGQGDDEVFFQVGPAQNTGRARGQEEKATLGWRKDNRTVEPSGTGRRAGARVGWGGGTSRN